MPAGIATNENKTRRHGFTLVELLVVLGIIALLAALLTPAVLRSLSKARNSAIKTEIDMLHMALMNYQSEYGSLPPCLEPVQFFTSGSFTAGGPSAKHLRRLFPRCADVAYQLNSANKPAAPVRLTPLNALVSWLSGFTSDPASPLFPGTSRIKLFEFDKSRIASSSVAYHPSGNKDSPYIYFDAANYGKPEDPTPFLDGPNTYRPEFRVLTTGTEFFNATTFQILCAGRDEQWGTEDDLSNFWPGTRKEFTDSLKN